MGTQESAEVLLAYGACKLDAETTAALEKHMETCPACRESARGLRSAWEALDAFEAPPVSPDFDRNLYRRIAREVSWWDLLVRPFRAFPVRQGLPMAAAAGVMLLAGVMLYRPAAPPPPPPDAVQAVVEELRPDQVENALDDMEMLREFSHAMRPDAVEAKKM
ncbi:MAG: zf-HC2 domain-containing protein [Acidobacteriia bacterium]|nr:zf-HC2 domain-containing protein [Terriglobia bacterium]